MVISTAPLSNIDTFGADLRRLRQQAHLTQAEFAGAVGVSERSVQNWEAGALPRPAQRRRLIEFFGNGKEAV